MPHVRIAANTHLGWGDMFFRINAMVEPESDLRPEVRRSRPFPMVQLLVTGHSGAARGFPAEEDKLQVMERWNLRLGLDEQDFTPVNPALAQIDAKPAVAVLLVKARA